MRITLISPAYCFEISVLRECLKMDASDIESYVSCLRKKNMAVVDVYAPYIEGMEIADREDLWCCNAILRREINASLMRKGVTFIDPESAYIDADVANRHGHSHIPRRIHERQDCHRRRLQDIQWLPL